MGEIIFLVGYKTLCVNGEGLLALMLILPSSDCTVLNAKLLMTPPGVPAELPPSLNKPCCVPVSC